MEQTRVYTVRGALPGEVTLRDAERIWGLGRTQTWTLVVKKKVIPYRKDRYQIYVKRKDVEDYKPDPKRGRYDSLPNEGTV